MEVGQEEEYDCDAWKLRVGDRTTLKARGLHPGDTLAEGSSCFEAW